MAKVSAYTPLPSAVVATDEFYVIRDGVSYSVPFSLLSLPAVDGAELVGLIDTELGSDDWQLGAAESLAADIAAGGAEETAVVDAIEDAIIANGAIANGTVIKKSDDGATLEGIADFETDPATAADDAAVTAGKIYTTDTTADMRTPGAMDVAADVATCDFTEGRYWTVSAAGTLTLGACTVPVGLVGADVMIRFTISSETDLTGSNAQHVFPGGVPVMAAGTTYLRGIVHSVSEIYWEEFGTTSSGGGGGNLDHVSDDPTPVLGGNLAHGGYNVAGVTPTEMGYLSGITSAVQTQLDAKAAASTLTTHTSDTANPHSVTAAQVGFGTSDSPQLAGLNLGHATDTTISRSAAGIIAVEGVALYAKMQIQSKSAAYTLVIGDAQTTILHPSADTTARTFTIPANASVAFPVGTFVTFINQASAGVVTIAITTDTMRLAGAGTTGSRTLAANGVATAVKVTTTEWLISGTGLT